VLVDCGYSFRGQLHIDNQHVTVENRKFLGTCVKAALTGAEKEMFGADLTSPTRRRFPFSTFLVSKVTKSSTEGVKFSGITLDGSSFAFDKEVTRSFDAIVVDAW
jgi:hypothetical protein